MSTGPAMIIAPGRDIDRCWADAGYAIIFPITRTSLTRISRRPGLDDELIKTSSATRRTYRLPGWRVLIDFYIENGFEGSLYALPDGYVLPGSVVGQVLESEPLDEETRWLPYAFDLGERP